MTKASIKKSLGVGLTIEFALGVGVAIGMNIHNAEILNICFVSLLVLIAALFALKLGTGAIARFRTSKEDGSEQ